MVDIFSVKNKVVVITGAGGDIGWKLSQKIFRAGAEIYGLDKSFTGIQKKQVKMNLVQCDVTKNKEIDKIFKKIFRKHKKIDVLINAAGVTFPQSKLISSKNIELWRKTLDVNLNAAYYCCMSAINYMKKNKHGSIINITIKENLNFIETEKEEISNKIKELNKSIDEKTNIIPSNFIKQSLVKTEEKNETLNDKEQKSLDEVINRIFAKI